MVMVSVTPVASRIPAKHEKEVRPKVDVHFNPPFRGLL